MLGSRTLVVAVVAAALPLSACTRGVGDIGRPVRLSVRACPDEGPRPPAAPGGSTPERRWLPCDATGATASVTTAAPDGAITTTVVALPWSSDPLAYDAADRVLVEASAPGHVLECTAEVVDSTIDRGAAAEGTCSVDLVRRDLRSVGARTD